MSLFWPNLTSLPTDAPVVRAYRIKHATVIVILWLVLIGIVGILVFASATPSTESLPASLRAIAAVSAAALLLAGASLLSGSLLGFLFGIPRTLQGSATDAGRRSYQVNTNLEQISDWLTKIIVGVTLVELQDIPPALQSLTAVLGPSFGDPSRGAAFAGTLIVYYAILGFLFGYLTTRLYVAGAFVQADEELTLRVLADAATPAIEQASKAAPPRPPSAGATPAASPAAAELATAADRQQPAAATLPTDTARAIALSYYMQGRYDDAVPFFDRANENPLADPTFTMQHAIALGEADKEAERRRAVALLEALAARRLAEPDVYQLLGYYLLWYPDRASDAIRHNERYIASRPDDGAGYLNLACAYGDLYAEKEGTPEAEGYKRAATEALRQAVTLEPAWRARAIQLRRTGEHLGALPESDFQEAIATSP